MGNLSVLGLILLNAEEEIVISIAIIIAAIVGIAILVRFFKLCSDVKNIRELLEKKIKEEKKS